MKYKLLKYIESILNSFLNPIKTIINTEEERKRAIDKEIEKIKYKK